MNGLTTIHITEARRTAQISLAKSSPAAMAAANAAARVAIEREFVDIIMKPVDDNSRLSDRVRQMDLRLKFTERRMGRMEHLMEVK